MRAMKDSGIEWIGQIPHEWNTIRAKYVTTITNGSDPKTEGNTPVYGSGSGCFKTCGEYKEGPTVLLGRKGTVDIPQYITGNYWNVDTAFDVKTVEEQLDLEFYYFAATCFDYKYYTSTTTLPSMTQTNYGNMYIPFPPVDVQRHVVVGLQEKLSGIDALIAAKEKTNTLLKERRQSIIYEAVTKGLNPDAPMKDSGIEWIGQIPEHWDMMRAKFFAEITNGSDPKTEGDIPVYGSGSESFRTCGEFKEGPVVLLGRKGATLHIPHYVEGKYWNVDTAFDVRTNEKICLLKFYYYTSICFDYKLYISTTTLPSMTQYNYGNMVIPIPSIEEQAEILKFIECKLSELDQVITATEDNIQKLKEYRQSIIYEAVTGKIEV